MRSASAGAAEGAVPAATRSAVDTLEDEELRQRIAAVLGTPEVQRTLQELSAGASQGVIAGLTNEQMEQQVAQLATVLTRAVISAAANGASAAMNGAAADRLAASLTATVMRAAADQIPESLAPAMRKALTEQLGPGIAEAVRSPDFKAAMAEMTHDIARAAVMGSNEGLADLAERQRKNENGTPLGPLLLKRTWLFALLVIALALAVPLVLLLRERSAARRFRDEALLRSARTASILGALAASREEGWSAEVLALLREQLLDEASRARHPEPRAEEPPVSHPGPPRPRPA